MKRPALTVTVLSAITLALAATIPVDDLGKHSPLEVRTNLIDGSKKYLGIPYRSGSVNPQEGLDCSGFVRLSVQDLARRLGLPIPVPRISKDMYAWTQRIEDVDRQPGDLVFFQAGVQISHVGIYLGTVDGQPTMISSASEGPATGVIYSSLNEPYWKRHYVGAGRLFPAASGASARPTPIATPVPVPAPRPTPQNDADDFEAFKNAQAQAYHSFINREEVWSSEAARLQEQKLAQLDWQSAEQQRFNAWRKKNTPH